MTDKTTAHTLENNALSPGLEQTSGDGTSLNPEDAAARGGWGYEPIVAFWKAFEVASAKHGHYESTQAALNAAFGSAWRPWVAAPHGWAVLTPKGGLRTFWTLQSFPDAEAKARAMVGPDETVAPLYIGGPGPHDLPPSLSPETSA